MKKYNYNKRKVCIVTTNRADYGHLRNLILSIKPLSSGFFYI